MSAQHTHAFIGRRARAVCRPSETLHPDTQESEIAFTMKRSFLAASVCLFSLTLSVASAQQSAPLRTLAQAEATSRPVAGEVPQGWMFGDIQTIVHGRSAKKHILGKTVWNNKKERLGRITDVIVTSKDSVSFAIIDVSGFLGMSDRHVAVPMRKLHFENGKIELPDATKFALNGLPPFYYAQ